MTEAASGGTTPGGRPVDPPGRLRAGFWYWVHRGWLRVAIAVILFRHLKVAGQENVPREGGLLVISNHLASADPPVLGALFPRPLHFMAKAEWWKNKIVGWGATGFLCYPVKRHTPDRGALRFTLELLAAGEAVCIYPEGTRSEDAQVKPPEAGAGFLARKAGVPILPVATWGGEKALPKGARLPHPADVHMVYGQPFTLPDRPMNHQETAEFMMARVAELLPPEYRGIYRTPPVSRPRVLQQVG